MERRTPRAAPATGATSAAEAVATAAKTGMRNRLTPQLCVIPGEDPTDRVAAAVNGP